MAHFAEIDANSLVASVIVVPDEHEDHGQEFINNTLGLPGVWLQTSYTSREGNRVDPDTNEITVPGEHFRYNYAGKGYSWDANFGNDGAFIPPRPEGMNSWVVDPLSATWIPPVPMPEGDGIWVWSEDDGAWIDVGETEGN